MKMRRRRLTQSEMGRFLQARMSTVILRYPSGKFGIAGSVPIELALKKTNHLGQEYWDSQVWDSEQEAINALLAIGIRHFQKVDCSWYDVDDFKNAV